MRRGIPIGLALLALFQATDARAQGPRVGVRDDAKLFTREAIHTADASLKEVQRDHGWQVVVRTIESLEGDSPSERAIADEKALKLHGLYVLIAKAEHKVWVQPSGSAAKVFSKEKIKAITTAITDGFHAKEFDKGLLDAVTAIRKDAARAGPDRAGVEAPAPPRPGPPSPPELPAPAHGPLRPANAGRGNGMVVLIGAGVAVLVILWLLSRASRRPAQPMPMAGAQPPQPGYGPAPAPGYGPRPAAPPPGYGPPPGYAPGGYGAPPPGHQGGGFVSGALGGLGGAVLGNILYDQFGRPHEAPAPHHEAGGAAVPPYSHDQPAEAPRESYDPNQGGGGDWGDAGSSAPDESQAAATGGGDWDQGGGAGGDWGGDAGQDDAGAGGDWGGNEPAGGDDFGSPDSGAGGDWGGGNDDNQGGSW